jgi:hypothetical protein
LTRVRAAACTFALFVASCGGNEPRGVFPPGLPPEVRVGIGEDLVPAESLTDWVSYSVQVSQVFVTSEQEIPPPRAVLDRGEGYIGRKVRLRVDRTFWTSTGAISPGATPSPKELDVVVAGWLLQQGGKRILFALVDSPRIEVGGAYVIALITLLRPPIDNSGDPPTTRNPGNSGSGPLEAIWSPLSTRAVFEVAGNRIATEDVHIFGNSRVAADLAKLSGADLEQVLSSTSPDPVAAKYWHLPPHERFLAVSAEKAGGP